MLQRVVFAWLFLFNLAFGQGDFADFLEKNSNDELNVNPEDVIQWVGVGATSYENQYVAVRLQLHTEGGFSIYQTKLEFSADSGGFVRHVIPAATKKFHDPISDQVVDVYDQGEFQVLFQFPEGEIPEQVSVYAKFVGCTTKICLFPHSTKVNLAVFPSAEPMEAALLTSEKQTFQNKELKPLAELSWEESLVKYLDGESWWLMILVVFLGGIITNLTPCVYPMIPITIRLLGSVSERPFVGASGYALGIVASYTSLGLVAAWSGAVFGQFMASVWVGWALAFIMAMLGLGMLGFGNLSMIQSFGQKFSGGVGFRAALIMGLGAGLVAAPCTGPILAALLTYTSQGQDLGQSAFMLFLYSLGFSFPYLILGGLSARVAAVKVAPSIQNVVKAIFASVMFGLSFYYLRLPLYDLLKEIHIYLPLLTKVSLFLGAFGLLVALKFSSLDKLKSTLILPAVVLGFGFFSMSQWIGRGESQDRLWVLSESEGFALAQKRSGPVLIDLWAEWCEACKKMERTTFADPTALEFLSKNSFTLIKLDLTQDSEVNELIQERYNVQSLPTLIFIDDASKPEKFTQIRGYVGATGLVEKLRGFLKGEG